MSIKYYTEKIDEFIKNGQIDKADKMADEVEAMTRTDHDQALSLQRAVAAARVRLREKLDEVD